MVLEKLHKSCKSKKTRTKIYAIFKTPVASKATDFTIKKGTTKL